MEKGYIAQRWGEMEGEMKRKDTDVKSEARFDWNGNGK